MQCGNGLKGEEIIRIKARALKYACRSRCGCASGNRFGDTGYFILQLRHLSASASIRNSIEQHH